MTVGGWRRADRERKGDLDDRSEWHGNKTGHSGRVHKGSVRWKEIGEKNDGLYMHFKSTLALLNE